jgi:riboflavin synthase
MFSGIVEEIGMVKEIFITPEWQQLKIQAEKTLVETHIGDSIAVNGACLTVIAIDDKTFTFQAVPETLAKTNLSFLQIDSPVNLERAITANSRIGGHMVQGHVDMVCHLRTIEIDKNGTLATFSLPDELKLLVVNKGFITLDGMSLTVINKHDDQFSIAFIPHTIQASIVQFYQPGQKVNLEVDVIGKYVHQYFIHHQEQVIQNII